MSHSLWLIDCESWHYWPQVELYLVYISDLNHFYLPEKVCLSSIKIDWAVNKSMSKPAFAAIGSCDLLRSPMTMYLHVHPRTTSFNPIRTKSLSTTVPWILVDKRYDSYLMSANHCVMGWIIPWISFQIQNKIAVKQNFIDNYYCIQLSIKGWYLGKLIFATLE